MPPLPCAEFSDNEQLSLLDIARRSIQNGFASGNALQIDDKQLGEKLGIKSAVFITLTRFGKLRGCVGSLEPTEPLAQAIANSAFNAAFKDKRFEALQVAELEALQIEISVLSDMEALSVDSRQALLEALQPGIDGLLLEDQGCRSTFLPKVWEKIESPAIFLEQLMQKAGLPETHWSNTIRLHRYQTTSFAEN